MPICYIPNDASVYVALITRSKRKRRKKKEREAEEEEKEEEGREEGNCIGLYRGQLLSRGHSTLYSICEARSISKNIQVPKPNSRDNK
jgi:hypothetical protein